MAGTAPASPRLDGPSFAEANDATHAHSRGPLDGHPEASAGLHRAVKGLEERLAGVLASSLTPLSQEVIRLRDKSVALQTENQRLRELLEEAGLGSNLPPPHYKDSEDIPAYRPQRRNGTQPVARRQRSRSPESHKGEADAAVTVTPRGPGGGRKPTLLASVAASAVSPESRLPSHDASGRAAKAGQPNVIQDYSGSLRPHDAPGSRMGSLEPPSVTKRVVISVGDDVSVEGTCEAGSEASPPEVELQPIWKDLNNTATLKKGAFHRTKTPLKKRNGSFMGVGAHDLQKLILPPTSHIRMLWEAIGAIVIIYDLVTVPLQAFDIYSFTHFLESLRHVMIYLHIFYWTIDLPCSFFVGYYVNGVLETRVKKTAKRYLTSWFVIDICLVTCDWIMFSFELNDGASTTNLSYLMYGRILRLLRFVRLVRLLKLHSMFNKILESIHSEYALTFLRVSEHVLLIVCLNHFIACTWYWIGAMAKQAGDSSWIDRHVKGDDTTAYAYATALHWSLTQFTPASMEVFPTNTGERSYNVVVVILAMVTFSTFISSITEAMTRLRKSNGLKAAQYLVLRQYLGENQVSMQLAMRIWRHLEHGSKARRSRKMWRDVELFREIPDTLQMDLHHEVYMPILTGHPFFYLFNELSPVAMRSICHYATQEISLVSEQTLFSEGQVADRMFFIIEGLLEYQVACNELSGMWKEKHKLTYPDWLCETVIWVKWFYHGTATAKQHSSLLALNVTTLHSIMKEYVGTIPFSCQYAQRFAEYARTHPTGMCDTEDDVEKIEALANEAWDHVENKLHAASPKGIRRAGTAAASSKKPGNRRVTWGRRMSLGSMLSGFHPKSAKSAGTHRSGSQLSSFFNFFQGGNSMNSTTSLESAKANDVRPSSPAPPSSSNGRVEGEHATEVCVRGAENVPQRRGCDHVYI